MKILPDEALRLLSRALQPMEAARRLTEAIHDNACRVHCDGNVVKSHMAVDVRVVARLEDDRRWTATIESISRQWHGQSYRWEFEDGEVKALFRTPPPTPEFSGPFCRSPDQPKVALHMELFGRVSEVRIRQPFPGEALPDPIAITGSKPMADTSATATRETSGTKSILRLIRSTPASNPEAGALRAEVEGLRLALSIAQEALREERSDKEHWRDEAKQLRQLLSGQKPEPKIINVAAPEAPHTVEAPTLGPALETEPEKRPSSEMTSADSAAPAPQRWWGRLFA